MSAENHAAPAAAGQRTVPGQLATGRRYIPDVPVVSHRGQRLMFHGDLVKGRVVVVNFLSVASDATYPVAANLARVARLLGGRLGREIHILSITTDPERDTPEALRGLAARHRAPEGWHFLTGEPSALRALREAFYIHDGGHDAPAPIGHDAMAPAQLGHAAAAGRAAPDCSLGLLRYGNDAAGLWGSAPAQGDPALIVERLGWLRPRAGRERSESPRRGGPRSSS